SLSVSATLATATVSTPDGRGTSIASAYATATCSEKTPPQAPPATPKPYLEMGGTERQLPVSRLRHAGHVPQLIWNGTATRSPGSTALTASPTASTSPTHS